MRKLLVILALLLLTVSASAQTTYTYPNTDVITVGTQSAVRMRTQNWQSMNGYIYLPPGYDSSSSKRYATIFFYHGAGENGTYTNTLNNGLPQLIQQGVVPYSVSSPGDTTWFIVYSVAGGTMGVSSTYTQIPVDYRFLLDYYNIKMDTTRIYATGLSAGGEASLIGPSRYPNIFAAGVPMSTVWSNMSESDKEGLDSTWILQIHGYNDATANFEIARNGVLDHNTSYPDFPALLWTFAGGHGSWNTYYTPTTKWTSNNEHDIGTFTGGSIYDWMLTHVNGEGHIEPPEPVDTPVYKISLSPYTKFWNGDTVFYQLNDINASSLVDSLIDEQDADPLNGVNTEPKTTFMGGNSTSLFYPTVAVLDLGGMYKVTNQFFYDVNGTAEIDMVIGTPNNWSTDTLKFNPSGTGWSDAKDTFYTRYLKVFYDPAYGTQKIREMILYGHLVTEDSMSRTGPAQVSDYVTDNTMGQFVGVNSFGDVPIRVRDVAGLLREYVAQDYLDTADRYVAPDDLSFVFSKFSKPDSGSQTPYYFPEADDLNVGEKTFGSLYNELNYYKNNGQVGLFSILNVPTYFKTIGTKPVEPGASTDSATSYKRTARLAYNLAAVFGSREVPVDSIQVSNYDSTGLDVMQFLETGNEMNATWGNTDMYYYSPQEFMAYSSALYDGDAGTMGHRYGIKTADPSMTVVAAGDAGIHLERLKPYKYFSYYFRPDHKFPLDVFNFHAYPAGKSPGTAISPENDVDLNTRISGFADSCREICPTCEVWITEWGYDRNRASNLGVPHIQGLDSAQIQAMWTARYWFKLSFMGVDRAVIFQIRNDALQTDYDSVGVNQFNTTGLTSGHYYPAAEAPDGLNSTNYYAYPVYYVQRTIWKKLYNYKPDSIVYDNMDSLYVYRYRNADHPDSLAYVFWSGTQTNKVVDNFSIKTGHANTAAIIVTLADKHMDGITTLYTSNNSGEIPVLINEMPKLLFTTEGASGGQLVESDAPVNSPPIANAGSDQSLDYNVTSTILSGSGTDGDGSITNYLWEQVSGPTVTINSPSLSSTGVTGLASGKSYTFKLTVTDDQGAMGNDQVNVVVGAAPIEPTSKALLYLLDNGKIIIINSEK